jgi:phospholipase/carboxylesterase
MRPLGKIVDVMDSRVTRRQFTVTAGCSLASIAFAGCGSEVGSAQGQDGRIAARPRTGVATTLKTGPLGLGGADRDGVIQMPSSAPAGKLPLLVFLHGATQNGRTMLNRIGPAADQAGVVVFAPDSRGRTWDGITGGFGADVAFLQRALDFVFARVDVDPARLAIGGFSDGASYALTLGIANGDLFARVVACSPGFVLPVARNGRPRFFVSHGTSDQILPIDECSRMIVPRLKAAGYDVTYREFDGRHEIPAAIATEALGWESAVN